jgi:diadenosine tetraphosphate (Ap4A) HIT family hydrolase
VLRISTGCTGISTRQHNEPDGKQDVWHLHVHVTPRFKDDQLYARYGDMRPNEHAAAQASALRDCIAANPGVFADGWRGNLNNGPHVSTDTRQDTGR